LSLDLVVDHADKFVEHCGAAKRSKDSMKRVGTILMLTMLAGIFVGCSSQSSSTVAQPTWAGQRRELIDVRATQTRLSGKTMAEVVAAIGRPDHQAGDDQWDWWTYDEKFYDPITKRTLTEVTLVFFKGHLLEVTF
jgi:hypothetical protein